MLITAAVSTVTITVTKDGTRKQEETIEKNCGNSQTYKILLPSSGKQEDFFIFSIFLIK